MARFIKTVDAALDKQSIFRFGAFSLCSFLAIWENWYFMYSFLLLDVIFQSAMLQNVIKAVTIPGKSLLLTAMVGMIVMYNYAFVAFYVFRKDFDESCGSIVDCTTTTIYQGMLVV